MKHFGKIDNHNLKKTIISLRLVFSISHFWWTVNISKLIDLFFFPYSQNTMGSHLVSISHLPKSLRVINSEKIKSSCLSGKVLHWEDFWNSNEALLMFFWVLLGRFLNLLFLSIGIPGRSCWLVWDYCSKANIAVKRVKWILFPSAYKIYVYIIQ